MPHYLLNFSHFKFELKNLEILFSFKIKLSKNFHFLILEELR